MWFLLEEEQVKPYKQVQVWFPLTRMWFLLEEEQVKPYKQVQMWFPLTRMWFLLEDSRYKLVQNSFLLELFPQKSQ
jgi:hypothetical protein